MPEVIETTVFRLHELSDAAKDTARNWYRDGGFGDDWHSFVYEDFERICATLGIQLKTRPVRLMGGGTRQDPLLWFTGFCSQGDGACFEGYYSYAKGASAAIRSYAPTDEALHRIADDLQSIQRCNFYQLRAETTQRGRYYHANCMIVSVTRDSPTWQDMTADAEDILTETLRDLAKWLYRQLEREYEHLSSDEVVNETIEANAYKFTGDGMRFG